jgi:hypothetical protein
VPPQQDAPPAEDVTNEYVEFVNDQRIVVKSHPKMIIAGLKKAVKHGPTWTWTFVPGSGD